MQGLDIVAVLTRPGTYVLGIAVFILTFFTRRIIETLLPWWKKQADANAPKATYLTRGSRWWNEVVLYAVPVLFGCLFGILKSDFFFGDIADVGTRIATGGVIGWFSSFLYKVLRKVVNQKLGVDLVPDAGARLTDPPPGD